MSAEQHRRGGTGGYRGSHRSRSHQEAQGRAQQEEPQPVPEHLSACKGPPTMVRTGQELAELIDHAAAAGSFAYDSEFITEQSYVPKLCLLQAATPQRVFLVDPLEGLDLGPFWGLVADPAVEKVVHSGVQDLEPAARHTGRPPANVFDVQVAAGFVGLPYPLSLGRLMAEVLGVRLGKALTFTRWDERPLSAVHQRYAADDVRCLPAARAAIGQRLEALGHARWAAQECQALTEMALYQFDPRRAYLSVRNIDALGPRALAVTRELAVARDQAARREDLPPRTLLRDEVLIALARHPARSAADLAKVRGLPRPVERTYGESILQATARALALGDDQLPRSAEPRETAAEKVRLDSLWAAMSAFCLGQSVDPGLAATRQELARFLRSALAGQPADDCRLAQGWRKELLGEMLKAFLRGSAAIELTWSGGALRAAAVADNAPRRDAHHPQTDPDNLLRKEPP